MDTGSSFGADIDECFDALTTNRRRRGLRTITDIAYASPSKDESFILLTLRGHLTDFEWENLSSLVECYLSGFSIRTKSQRLHLLTVMRDYFNERSSRQEMERIVQERIEQKRIEQERLQQELIAKARLERERIERERIERERLEQKRMEQERLARERLRSEAIEQLQHLFRTNYPAADAYFSESCTAHLSQAEFKAEKLAFVRGWFEQNLPTATHGSHRLPDADQIAAIASVNGNTQVIARAGSGKTLALVYRTFFLLKHCRVAPEELLLLAFNRKAVVEIRKRLLLLLRPEAATSLAHEIESRRRSRRPGDKVQHESESIDTVASQLDLRLPYVLTFHALAHALVHPAENLLYDDKETGDKALGAAVQSVLDDYRATPHGLASIRSVMLSHFKTNWDELLDSGHLLGQAEFIQFRRSLPRLSLKGHQVKSDGEKIIADFLFEHGLDYRYERNFAAKGFNYKPDFTVFSRENKNSGVIIEYFGMQGDSDYDEQTQEKIRFWNGKPGWTLLALYPDELRFGGAESFKQKLQAQLEACGIPCTPLSEDEIWERLKDRAVDRFSECMAGFIGRCRKLVLTPEGLERRIADHQPATPAEAGFLEIARDLYPAYLARLAARQEEDFNGLMQRAATAVESGVTRFSKRNLSGDLASLRHLAIDEFQDFSDQFHRLLQALRARVPTLALFCVGDDWQAINGFAGSDLKFFQNFELHLGPHHRLHLPRNYRSVTSVVDLGNRLMDNLGPPAVAHQTEPGAVLLADLAKFKQEPVETLTYGEFDLLTPAILRIVGYAVRRKHQVALLFRQNTIAWTELRAGKPTDVSGSPSDFRQFLRSHFPKDQAELISVSTAHQFKGLEKAVILIPDALERAYPLIHPNWIFTRIFGDDLPKICAEERRLFYVALTRASRALILLTDSATPSPFLSDLEKDAPLTPLTWSSHFKPVTKARMCFLRLHNGAGRGEEPTRLIVDQLKASRFSWNSVFGAWIRLTDSVKIDALHKEPWALAADGVEVALCNGDQEELARYAIDHGVWRCLHDHRQEAPPASPEDPEDTPDAPSE